MITFLFNSIAQNEAYMKKDKKEKFDNNFGYWCGVKDMCTLFREISNCNMENIESRVRGLIEMLRQQNETHY